MSDYEQFKIVVTVPLEEADAVRLALGEAGAGRIGNYAFCSFSSIGVGRFLPQHGAAPSLGEVGSMEEVAEERIEVSCDNQLLGQVVDAIRLAHPYEEPIIDVYTLLPLPNSPKRPF